MRKSLKLPHVCNKYYENRNRFYLMQRWTPVAPMDLLFTSEKYISIPFHVILNHIKSPNTKLKKCYFNVINNIIFNLFNVSKNSISNAISYSSVKKRIDFLQQLEYYQPHWLIVLEKLRPQAQFLAMRLAFARLLASIATVKEV